MIKSLAKMENFYKKVLLLSFVLEIIWLIVVDTQPYSDFLYYHELAKNISAGGQWGDTYTSVGYSIFLGFIYKIFGPNLMVGKLLNILLTTTNYILVYLILQEIKLKERDKKCIFLLFVLYPFNIIYNTVLGSEILFTTLLLLITYYYFTDIKYKYYIIGVLVGINTMIKPFFILFSFLVFIVELIVHRKTISSVKHALLIFFIGSITISPWIYRNSKLNGQFTFVSNNGGAVLYINNNSQNILGRWIDINKIENSIVRTDEYKNANMTEKNKLLNNAAKTWIKNNPLEFVILGIKRLFNTYILGEDIIYSFYGSKLSLTDQLKMFLQTNISKLLIFLPGIYYLLSLSISTVINLFRKRFHKIDKFSIYILVLFYMFTSVYFITEGQGRYAYPLNFIMIYSFCKLFYSDEKKFVNKA